MHDLGIEHGLVLTDGTALAAHVYVDGDRITRVCDERRPARRRVDVAGQWVLPGLIDLHLNGAMGLDFTAGNLDALEAFDKHLLAQGVTSYLAALNTASQAERLTALRHAERTLGGREAPRCLGYYLEGPYYAPAQCGAHDPALMGPPDAAHASEILAAAPGRVKVWSLAPELDGALEFIGWLASQGVVPAIGHSSATFEQVVAAAQAGARLVTHVYACLTAFRGTGPQKQLGGNEGALYCDSLLLEVLSDGHHLSPSLASWVAKVAGPARVICTTDAMAAAGLADGKYPFLAGEVTVRAGVAYRGDGTHFAGSTATLPDCLANLHAASGWSPAQVAATATTLPAQLLNAWPERGSVRAGSRADLVILTPNWKPIETITGARNPLV